MAAHLRIKRWLRVLEAEGRARFLLTLDDHIDVASGATLHAALEILSSGPKAEAACAELTKACGLSTTEAQGYLDDLVTRGVVERFEPGLAPDLYERQEAFFDALSPVTEDAENLQRQRALHDAHVLLLGLGGIGHQVAQSLAAAGVGRLTLVDGDVVERSNLHRQILFGASDVGRPKVDAAKEGLARIAPTCAIGTSERMIESPSEWVSLVSELPPIQFVMISADEPVELVRWISLERQRGYHFMKCGYMSTQGLIGPVLGPKTKGYEEIFDSWGPLIRAQSRAVKAHNDAAIAPTIAAGNGILANIAALEIIKLLTGAGALTLLERRLLFDLRDYSSTIG